MDRRADGLTEEYARKARQVDWEYGGTPRPPPQPRGAPAPPREIGRVESQPLTFGRVRGWCFGAWGEGSTEVHELVQKVAEARLEVADLQPEPRGIPMSRAAQLAGLVGYVLVVKTFKNSTAERVPSECSQLRYTSDILEYLFKSTAERVPSECS